MGKTGKASDAPELKFPKTTGKGAGKRVGKDTVSNRELRRRAEARHRADVYMRVHERDRGFCRLCGRAGWTHLHHVVYRSKLGPDETGNLLTLCANPCHADVHAARVRLRLADGRDCDSTDADGIRNGVEVSRQDDAGVWRVVRYV